MTPEFSNLKQNYIKNRETPAGEKVHVLKLIIKAAFHQVNVYGSDKVRATFARFKDSYPFHE